MSVDGGGGIEVSNDRNSAKYIVRHGKVRVRPNRQDFGVQNIKDQPNLSELKQQAVDEEAENYKKMPINKVLKEAKPRIGIELVVPDFSARKKTQESGKKEGVQIESVSINKKPEVRIGDRVRGIPEPGRWK